MLELLGNARKNLRRKYKRNCIGCNHHYSHRQFCLHEGIFGRVYICLSCARKADEDSFIYEVLTQEFFFGEEI